MIKVALFNLVWFWHRMVRKFKKYRIESQLNSKSKRDKVAREVVNNAVFENCRVYSGERLDEDKIASLGREVDLLEGVDEIQSDSVNSIKADIPIRSDGKRVVFEDNRTNRTKRNRS